MWVQGPVGGLALAAFSGNKAMPLYTLHRLCIKPVGVVYPVTLFCYVRSSFRIHTSLPGPAATFRIFTQPNAIALLVKRVNGVV